MSGEGEGGEDAASTDDTIPWDVWLARSGDNEEPGEGECSTEPTTSEEMLVPRVVASMPHQKALCYGYCPAMEEHVLVRCRYCSMLVKEIGYGHHVASRHRDRAGSPDSISGDESQLFLLSPPPPASPKRTYFVEQRDDLVIKLSQATSTVADRGTPSRKRHFNQTSTRRTTATANKGGISSHSNVIKRRNGSENTVATAAKAAFEVAKAESSSIAEHAINEKLTDYSMKPPDGATAIRKKEAPTTKAIIEALKQDINSGKAVKAEMVEEKKVGILDNDDRKLSPPGAHPRPQSTRSNFMTRRHPLFPKHANGRPNGAITVHLYDRRMEQVRIQFGRVIVPHFVEEYPAVPVAPQRCPRAPRLRRLLTMVDGHLPSSPCPSAMPTPSNSVLRAALDSRSTSFSSNHRTMIVEPDVITLSESPPPPLLTAAVHIPPQQSPSLDEIIELAHMAPPALAPNTRRLITVPSPMPRPAIMRHPPPPQANAFYWSEPGGSDAFNVVGPALEAMPPLQRGSGRRTPIGVMPADHHRGHGHPHPHHQMPQPPYPRRVAPAPQQQPMPMMYPPHVAPTQWRRLRPNDAIVGGPSSAGAAIKLVPVGTPHMMPPPTVTSTSFILPIKPGGINVSGVAMNREIAGVQVVSLPNRNNGGLAIGRRIVVEDDGNGGVGGAPLVYRVQPVD